MGLAFCTYTLLMWITRLDSTYLAYGQYLDIAIIALPITLIFIAITTARKQLGLTVGKRLLIAIGIGLLSYLIYHPFLYVYHEYINPDWFESVVDLKQKGMVRSGAPSEEIAEAVAEMRAQNADQSGLFSFGPFVSSVLILPAVIALLSMIFIRGKHASPQDG